MALLAAYSFDEASGDFLDYSGNGWHVPLGATGARTTGHTNSGATKNGAAMVPFPAGLLTASQTANRTLMAWINGNGATWYVRWNHSDIGSGGWGILSLDGGVNINFRARNATDLAQSTTAIPVGWYHLTGTYDGTNLRTYLDGSLVDTRALTAPLRTDADSLEMMEWADSSTVIDDLRMYDEALDAATITTLMNTPVTSAAEVTGTGLAALGGPTATATGGRTVTGDAASSLGSLVATSTGLRTIVGTAIGNLGALTATATATRATTGTALAALGALTAVVFGQGPLPEVQLRVSGREPRTRVSGREPRESI